jgi:hypothetical protein
VTLRYIDPRVVTQQHAADMLFRPGGDGDGDRAA